MKGNNVLQLNEATMIAALQHYFETEIFMKDSSPIISSIDYDHTKRVFVVNIKEEE